MKVVRPLLLFFCLLGSLLFTPSLDAQVKLKKDFLTTLEAARLQYFGPLEDSFKAIRVRRNQVLDYDMAIRSKKKNLEIRYAIQLPKTLTYPHMNSLSLATSVASNEEDTAVAVHDISKEDLKTFYNADWGATFYFKPKTGFSSRKYCKMLALHAEDKASVYVFYLFDKINEELDQQLYPFRFEE